MIKDLGEADPDELLRISIIRGINRNHPHWYRVIIGSNPPSSSNRPQDSAWMAFIVSRIHTMNPESGENLDRFLQQYALVGEFGLAGAVLNQSEKMPVLLNAPIVKKKQLYVRHAWEIGRHDPDFCGILPDDDPIIPPDESSPPVLELLAFKRSLDSTENKLAELKKARKKRRRELEKKQKRKQ